MVDLAVKIEKLQPTYITLLVADTLFDAIDRELSKQLILHVQKDRRKCIRVVGLECNKSSFDTEVINESFTQTYKSLVNEKPIRGAPATKGLITGLPIPSAVVIDLVGWEFLQSIRATSGSSIPVFVLQGSSATQVFLASAPESLGGRGDFASKLEIQSKANNVPADEIRGFAQKVKTTGKIIKGAGMIPMHDYEVYPQLSCFDSGVSIAYLTRHMHRLFSRCDGIILNSSCAVEPAAIRAWGEWCAPRPVFSLGPLASIEEAEGEDFSDTSDIPDHIKVFLDNAVETYGPQSVIYISFGTVFWTTEPEKLWAMLDILISRHIPFILAHTAPQASIPQEVLDRVEASKLGILCRWAPQQFILGHSATGWFVSHCGQSSMLEALLAGVPMMCWPFRGDQPFNAVTLSWTLNVAYELFEARNGPHGLAPILRLGSRAPKGTIDAFTAEFINVLEQAKGEDGALKRANAKRISDEIKGIWVEGGSGWAEIRRLVRYLEV
ncbi:UDP-Glycosyltransferase/glycogen phosphorylase [Schizopora paradoxa]|uniref:UDP-Glycosyltransferase/glycogen phosphorylase n=1 Tax=Schizopora paradoxa TaxID=27342 RepID=A0A0H2S5Q7_9AGAM|nr:UDP-Glycosyltransferase/glycogen phosphorylase [Schizopora paradoxa]